MTAAIIFGLLFALMLTGMPVSIALGLTVLTFLFTLTTVPIEAVALKIFTGIEKFEIMAIPFFILAGNFLTHGGVAQRMIRFATSMVGHWHGGLGLAAVVACALFAAVSGSSPDHPETGARPANGLASRLPCLEPQPRFPARQRGAHSDHETTDRQKTAKTLRLDMRFCRRGR